MIMFQFYYIPHFKLGSHLIFHFLTFWSKIAFSGLLQSASANAMITLNGHGADPSLSYIMGCRAFWLQNSSIIDFFRGLVITGFSHMFSHLTTHPNSPYITLAILLPHQWCWPGLTLIFLGNRLPFWFLIPTYFVLEPRHIFSLLVSTNPNLSPTSPL